MALEAAKQYEDEVNRILFKKSTYQQSSLFMEVEAWKQEFEKVPEPVAKMCDPEKEKLKKFKCEMCDFRAMTALGVKKHLNKQHPWKERGIDD